MSFVSVIIASFALPIDQSGSMEKILEISVAPSTFGLKANLRHDGADS